MSKKDLFITVLASGALVISLLSLAVSYRYRFEPQRSRASDTINNFDEAVAFCQERRDQMNWAYMAMENSANDPQNYDLAVGVGLQAGSEYAQKGCDSIGNMLSNPLEE